jgi:ADP-ribosylglycohydrolase
MTLTTAQLDQACGVLLGTAAGDALGAASSSVRHAAPNSRSPWWEASLRLGAR